MPSSLAHYAVGAAGLQVLDVPRRKLALFGLWSIAPDLDVVPAIAWTLSAPHLPLGADGLRTGVRILGHRGFSHTLTAALLAGLLVWGLTRDRQHGIAAGLTWSLHVLLDTVNDWSTIPLWPVSDQTYMLPLVTGLDPLLTLFSVATVVALLGPIVAERLSWPGRRKRLQLERWGRRWGRPMAYATVAAVAFSAAMVGWTAATTDGGAALPAHAPRTAALDAPIEAEVEAWNVTTRWVPPVEGDTRRVPYVANATGDVPPGLVGRAECVLDSLGPFAPVDRPVWVLRQRGDGWIAEASDLVRNATGTEGPQVHIALDEESVRDAWIAGTGGDEEGAWFRSSLPSALWEESSCP